MMSSLQYCRDKRVWLAEAVWFPREMCQPKEKKKWADAYRIWRLQTCSTFFCITTFCCSIVVSWLLSVPFSNSSYHGLRHCLTLLQDIIIPMSHIILLYSKMLISLHPYHEHSTSRKWQNVTLKATEMARKKITVFSNTVSATGEDNQWREEWDVLFQTPKNSVSK